MNLFFDIKQVCDIKERLVHGAKASQNCINLQRIGPKESGSTNLFLPERTAWSVKGKPVPFITV